MRYTAWTITRELADALRPLLRPGMATLETGSGLSTELFEAAGCSHAALEHDAKYRGPNASILLRPLVGDPPWYDWVPARSYDLILIDGPPQGAGGRHGILRVLGDCLHAGTIIVIDDTRRGEDRRLAELIAARWGFSAEWHQEAPRGFCVLRRSPRRINQLSLSVTTACSADCRYCGQRPLRLARPNYQLRLAQVRRFADRSAELGVRYQRIMLTGGEPTCWRNLSVGLEILNAARLADHLGMYTNGRDPAAINRVAPLLDGIRISVTDRTEAAAAELATRWGAKIHIFRTEFRQPPDRPLDDVLPAVCGCPHQSYFDGRLYTCGPAASRLALLGRPIDDEDASCSVEDDFAAHYAEYLLHKRERLEVCEMCRVCISNGRVWARQKDTASERDA